MAKRTPSSSPSGPPSTGHGPPGPEFYCHGQQDNSRYKRHYGDPLELGKLAVIVFLVSGIGIIGVALVKPKSSIELLTDSSKTTDQKVEQLAEQWTQMSQKLETLQHLPPESALSQALASLQAQQVTQDKRMKILEMAISENPERALSVPLMRKDLEVLQTRITSIQEATHNDVERLYTVTLWVLTTVVSIALAFLGLAWTHLRKSTVKAAKPEIDDNDDNEE